MHQLDTAPAPAARHLSVPMPVVLPEVERARHGRVLCEVALIAAAVTVPCSFAALIVCMVQS